jgi:hypothetical protein
MSYQVLPDITRNYQGLRYFRLCKAYFKEITSLTEGEGETHIQGILRVWVRAKHTQGISLTEIDPTL